MQAHTTTSCTPALDVGRPRRGTGTGASGWLVDGRVMEWGCLWVSAEVWRGGVDGPAVALAQVCRGGVWVGGVAWSS